MVAAIRETSPHLLEDRALEGDLRALIDQIQNRRWTLYEGERYTSERYPEETTP